MAVYEYTAADELGAKFSGSYENISSIALLRRELAKMGHTLIKAKRRKKQFQTHIKITPSEVVTFTYKFAGMCSAGLSILRSLETLEEQTEKQAFRNIILDIRQNVQVGSTLKEAFGKHREVFSDFFIGMVDAGETGGRLSETLEMTAGYLEKQVDLKQKIKSAFAYPVVVGIMCLIIMTCLIIFVIPVFSKIYKQLHVQLPAPTQVLVSLSVLSRNWWWAILPAICGVGFLLSRLLKKPAVKGKWDEFKLNMPALGQLNRMIVVSRFIRTFAILISSGVSLIKALEIGSLVADNRKIAEISKDLQKSVETGNSVADSMKKHELFPSLIIQLADSGEQSGCLAEMLNKGVDFLDKDIDRKVASLLVKLEPALTVIMGTIVGFILLGVYLPMFDYMAHLK